MGIDNLNSETHSRGAFIFSFLASFKIFFFEGKWRKIFEDVCSSICWLKTRLSDSKKLKIDLICHFPHLSDPPLLEKSIHRSFFIPPPTPSFPSHLPVQLPLVSALKTWRPNFSQGHRQPVVAAQFNSTFVSVETYTRSYKQNSSVKFPSTLISTNQISHVTNFTFSDSSIFQRSVNYARIFL